MKIENEFRVSAPLDEAWQILTDLETIAPCMPGAQLTLVEDETFSGTVNVKVGPVTAEYAGTARFVSKDDAGHRAELSAKGRDSRGSGNAEAMIVAQLSADGEATLVSIDTELKVSGKVAQFGRGVMIDVSKKLMTQFAECLEEKIQGPTEPAPGGDEHDRETSDPEPVEALDVMEFAGGAMMKRVAPVIALALAVLILYLITRGSRDTS